MSYLLVGTYLAFLAFYVFYLLIGGYMFYSIECPEEIKVKRRLAAEKKRFMTLIEEDIGDLPVHNETLNSNLTSFINHNIQRLVMETNLNSTHEVQEENCERWSFFNSFFFGFTSITTIGYGKITPETQLGRGACLLYSIIGIPINNILISSIASLFMNKGSGIFPHNCSSSIP